MSAPSNVKKQTLDNGIRIITDKMPLFKSASIGVWVNAGSRDEKTEENGLSHLVEHMIFKGTENRTAFDIAKEFDSIGGYTNAFTSYENTCYHAKVINTHIEKTLDIFSDIFLNSVLDSKEIEKELPVILQEIAMIEETPDEYIQVLANAGFWQDHPLGRSITGAIENIINFNAEAVKNFFGKFYQPEHIIISAAGDIDHDRFVELAARRFGKTLPNEQLFPKRTAPKSYSSAKVHFKDTEQTHISFNVDGVSLIDEDLYALSVLNTILGGNMSSRLFQEIREKRGLAYSAASFVSSYEDCGMLNIYAAVQKKKLHKTLKLILEQIQNLKKIPVNQTELKDAKEYLKNGFILSSECTDNQMMRAAQCEISVGEYIPISQVTEKIDSVTTEDISRLWENIFNSEKIGLTILGPIQEDIKEFERYLVEKN